MRLLGGPERCLGSVARPELATPLKEEEQGAASRWDGWVLGMTEDCKVDFQSAERRNFRTLKT